MALNPPYNLTASADGAHKINLAWDLGDSYSGIRIWRKPSGGAYSELTSVGGSVKNYSDTSCQDGKKYFYKLDAFKRYPPPQGVEWSDYSNEANATTVLPVPDGMGGTCLSPTSIKWEWNDNSQNEDGFKIYGPNALGVFNQLIATKGPNVTSHTETGLTPAQWYKRKVLSYNADYGNGGLSNLAQVFTADPPAKPTELVPTVLGTTKIRLNWKDNADNETDFKVERSATGPTTGFSQIGTVGANITTYLDESGLSSNTQYWYRVRAHNNSGNSGYSNVATAVTWAAIAKPTNLRLTGAKVGGSYGVEVTFDDNSELEDYHIIERKIGAGSFSELVSLEPNRTYYFNSGCAPDELLTYRVRAKQGASTYSDYSDEASIILPNVPVAPTGLTVTEYQDTWLRLTWTKTSGETGYIIEKSTNGTDYSEVARIGAGLETFKVLGLSASTQYWFRVAAYSAAGNSSYTSPVTQTTRSAYVVMLAKFERLIRRTDPLLIYLVEVNPAKVISGWSLASGQTYTYEAVFDERGADLVGLQENGVDLAEKTSVAEVEAAAGTWWHDITNKKVYLHTTGGDDPVNALIVGSFWLYFTSWQDGTTIFNGKFYLPLVAQGGIPDITQGIQPYFQGNFSISSGSVAFINGYLPGYGFYFDKIFSSYLWLNRLVKIRAGGEGFAYSDFVTINSGTIYKPTITDHRFNLELRDLRDGIHKTVPETRYSLDEYPDMDENSADKVRPYCYGAITNAVPTCVNKTNLVYEFQAGRFKSITQIVKNGTVLTGGTDYFVDYQRGRITLARGTPYSDKDIILVDFNGAVNSADEEISNGADVFIHFCQNFLNLKSTDLDFESIYETKYANATLLSLQLWKEMSSDEIVHRIEQSVMAWSVQNAEGQLGLRMKKNTPEGNAPYIQNFQVFDFSAEIDQESVFSGINLYYDERQQDEQFSLISKSIPSAIWKHGTQKSLDIYAALASASDAEALANNILTILDNHPFSFIVPQVFYTCLPGDIIHLSRDRFPTLSGTTNNMLLMILSITKSISAGKTIIKAEKVIT